MEVVEAVAIGFAAGVMGGLLGVGGGIVFVPALTLVLGLSVIEAQATSLLAMIPVSLAGALQQRGYGNLRVRDAALIGWLALALGGAAAGVALANALPERALEVGFAGLLIVVAVQLARRGLTRPSD